MELTFFDQFQRGLALQIKDTPDVGGQRTVGVQVPSSGRPSAYFTNDFCVAQSQQGVDHEADYRALTRGLFPGPGADEALRARLLSAVLKLEASLPADAMRQARNERAGSVVAIAASLRS